MEVKLDTSNNPAGRLLNILQEGQSLLRNATERDKKAFRVWQKILMVPPDNTSLLLKRLGKLYELPQVIEEQVRQQPDIKHDLYLKWMKKVEAGFRNINLTGNFQLFIDPIDAEALHGLEFCEELLSRRAAEKTFSESKIAELLESVEELIKEISELDFDQQIKTYMLDKLYLVRNTLQEYRICGGKPIGQALETVFGSLALDKELYEKTNKDETGKKFWDIMVKLAILIQITAGSIMIGNQVVELIPDSDTQEIIEQVDPSDDLNEEEILVVDIVDKSNQA